MLEVQIYKKLAEFDLDVSFQVDDYILGLMGASGSGKSMTLKCIAGIETPDQGRIVLNGRVLFDSEKKINVPIQKRNVGYMFQSYALFPNMNVYENIGQRQRVALARLMAYEPDVLLLDEPFSALDEDLKEDLLQELKSELQISKPVIFVSHDKEEVNYLCDLKYKIKQGEII